MGDSGSNCVLRLVPLCSRGVRFVCSVILLGDVFSHALLQMSKQSKLVHSCKSVMLLLVMLSVKKVRN